MNKIQLIQDIVTELFAALGIEVSRIEKVTDHELDTTVIDVRTPERGLFSYNHGELLRAMNHIVRKKVEQKVLQGGEGFDAIPQYILDVNNEQTKRIADLKAKARIAVNRVKSFSTEIELEPMTSYDRLMIHTFLSKDKDVETTSVGEGLERRIVKPA